MENKLNEKGARFAKIVIWITGITVVMLVGAMLAYFFKPIFFGG